MQNTTLLYLLTVVVVGGMTLAVTANSKVIKNLACSAIVAAMLCAGYSAYEDGVAEDKRVSLALPVTHASSPDLYVECVNGYQFVKHTRGGVAQFFIQTDDGKGFKPALCEQQVTEKK